MKTLKFLSISLSLAISAGFLSCSNNDEPDNNDQNVQSVTIGFQNVPENLIASDAYGSNLYFGDSDQITAGWITPLNVYDDTYIQFSINYGETYDQNYNVVWGYSFFQGGIAISKYHNMTEASYSNQLSVYDTTSPGGGNFAVAYGASLVTDPNNATLSDYAECGRIYITDSKGYSVSDPGVVGSLVDGVEKEASFKSVWINNTTYTYLTMLNGNPYASALNKDNKGWFKVQFIAFDKNDPDSKPVGYTEAYLANFDESQAGGYTGIIDEWIKVDLSSLPYTSVLVINFTGSDMGEYGLNTPKYCALDNFEIEVRK